jgi:hypothetical protein
VAEKYKDQGYNIIPEDNAEKFKMRLFIEDYSKKMNAIQMKFFGWAHKPEEDKQKLIQEVN